jgi:hypothetical protein
MISLCLFAALALTAYGQDNCDPAVSDPTACSSIDPGNTNFDCCVVVEGACIAGNYPECPPTAEPTTSTTQEATTTCYCPSPAPTTPIPTTSKGTEFGCGNCDCDGGVLQIRYIYQDTVPGVNIRIYYDTDRSEVLCNFNNVQPNEEVTCPIEGNTATASGYSKFAKETPFTITYPSGTTCEAQYHTSCSSNIVGFVLQECNKLVVSGWVGANNGDCDDCQEPCSCGSTQYTTTWNPEIYATRIGDHCYCDNGCTPSPVALTKSKAKKSKGSKGKGKTSNAGAGCGDCDCDKKIGMQMLRVRYSGSTNANIYFYDKKGENIICESLDVDQGAETTCSVAGTAFEKLQTNTVVKVIDPSTNEECITEIHTSCSRDIVGTIGSADCGLLVTGWADDSECDDIYEECSCEDGVLVYEGVDPYEEPEKEVSAVDDVCYCSNREDGLNNINNLSTARRRLGKKASDVALGVGSCDCDKSTGMQLLRFLYKGTETANSITIYYDKNMLSNEVICSYTSVATGDENECRIADFTDASGRQIYGDFDTNTYLVIETDSTSCTGSIHTSCSRDIVGYAAEGCDSVVVTGWADGDGDCDDGFDPCDCDSEYENAFRISAANSVMSGVYVALSFVAVVAAVFAF